MRKCERADEYGVELRADALKMLYDKYVPSSGARNARKRDHHRLTYVFHSVEQSDKDGETTQRLMCEGATKNRAIQEMLDGLAVEEGFRKSSIQKTLEWVGACLRYAHEQNVIPSKAWNCGWSFCKS